MATLPWEFSVPGTNEEGVPNVPSPEGEMLGAELARLTEPALAAFKARYPDAPDMCHDCAFRKGTVPNRSLPTVGDALKCVVEGELFYCHHGVEEGKPKRLCSGFEASYLAAHGNED